jgi:hypothetical protein
LGSKFPFGQPAFLTKKFGCGLKRQIVVKVHFLVPFAG